MQVPTDLLFILIKSQDKVPHQLPPACLPASIGGCRPQGAAQGEGDASSLPRDQVLMVGLGGEGCSLLPASLPWSCHLDCDMVKNHLVHKVKAVIQEQRHNKGERAWGPDTRQVTWAARKELNICLHSSLSPGSLDPPKHLHRGTLPDSQNSEPMP